MFAVTGIQWTDETWNPLRASVVDLGDTLRGWGCRKVSPGCANCYAEKINHRLGTGLPYTAEGVADAEHFLDERALTQPLRWTRGRRIFLSSMTDVFGEWVTDAQLDRIFAVMALTPQHTYQLLTKRAERMRAYLGPRPFAGLLDRDTLIRLQCQPLDTRTGVRPWVSAWPLPNVWLGVSVEDQQRADERIPELLATPAAVRFLSCEPLIGPIVFRWTPYAHQATGEAYREYLVRCGGVDEYEALRKLDWVIVGGESGPGARPMDLDWARSLVAQCKAAGVATFVKQLGARPVCNCGGTPTYGGTNGHEFSDSCTCCRDLCGGSGEVRLRDRKGGNPDEWPRALRVREFPL